MSITELPSSPSGQISHGNVREKVNEVVRLANGKIWTRITSSTNVDERYLKLDAFPSADNQIVRLPDPSQGDYEIEVHNQTSNAAFDVIVNNFDGSEVNRIKASEAFSYFKNATAPSGDVVELRGNAVPLLDIATYGDFNDNSWTAVPTGVLLIQGNGNQYANFPEQYVLDPTVPYECLVSLTNEPGNFSQEIVFTSGFTPSSLLPLGRPAFRGGGNLGAAITLGWSPFSKLSDLIDITRNRVAIGNTVADGSGNPNPTGVITLALPSNGGDELLTPPASPQPITGGDYNGYTKLILEPIEQGGALTFEAGGFRVGAGGAGKYRSSHAWLDIGSTANANNIGFIFGVQRGSQLFFSSRVTGDRASVQNDRTNISGGGYVDLQENDLVHVWAASENATTLTIYDANLGIEMTLPEILDTI